MKSLLLYSTILLNVGSAVAQTTFNVASYGATGNGVKDDRPAIQAALNAAHANGNAILYFPPGTYLLASATAPDYILGLQDFSKTFSVSISCTSATLTTSITAQPYMIFAEGGWQNSTVGGCTFVNTHGVTTKTTGAIVFNGGSGQSIQKWTITNNTFKNFSRHISLVGVTGLTLSNNSFLMENGRESGTGENAEPNVGVWMFNNSPNGTSINIAITRNTYNGCVSPTQHALSTVGCGDGLVYGRGSGIVVESNDIRKFSFEGIYVFRDVPGSKPPLIQANVVDGTVVPGDRYGGGQWGIRCDADEAMVTLNTVINTRDGITIYSVEHSSTDVIGSTIANNTITTTLTNAQYIDAGIKVTAASNLAITGNIINLALNQCNTPEVSTIYMTGVADRNSIGNAVTNNALSRSSGLALTSGIHFQWQSGATVAGNTIHGVNAALHAFNMSGSGSEVTKLTSQNTLVGNSQDVAITNGSFPTGSCSIIPVLLPNGSVGSPYETQTLKAEGCGYDTLTWTISKGTLPTGLTGCSEVTGSSCSIRGTPTTAGSPSNFTVQVTDRGANTASQALAITVCGH